MNGLTTDPFRISQELITEQTKNGKKILDKRIQLYFPLITIGLTWKRSVDRE